MAVLDNLEPRSVFKYFEEIAAIPHGSGNTDKISNYLVKFAKENNLKYIQDKLGNVIIFKPATKGYENSKPVIIQGHMDMVCEKMADCDIDFENDGLRLKTDGQKVWAKGTTLGGDDGIAVAMALAILAAPENSISHPPLEIVITVDEEIGMLGADYMDCSCLKARTMLNLDSEDEGVLLVSCAGGATAACHLPIEREVLDVSDEGKIVKLIVAGGLGGHSGVEINKQRANASKLLGRALKDIIRVKGVRLVNMEGGAKDNAIPRAAFATLYIENNEAYNEALRLADVWNKIIENEYSVTDSEIGSGIMKESSHSDSAEKISALTLSSAIKAVNALVLAPNGVRKMSNDIENMVQTSLNLGIMKLEESELILSFCVRSSIMTEKDELIGELESLMDALGGKLVVSGSYPAWEYKKDSRLRELMTERFEALYGRKPVVESLHAGVECGLFAGKLEGLDCVSFGPDMKAIHTPQETLYVDSVKRTYEYTLDILKSLK